MRQPITKNLIKDTPEGTDVFNMKWIHQGLTLVINKDEENPGKAEKKGKPIKNKKRGQTRPSIFFRRSIEPENLRERDKRNGAVTGLKTNRKSESNKKKIYFFRRLKVSHKKMESNHSEKHQQ